MKTAIAANKETEPTKRRRSTSQRWRTIADSALSASVVIATSYFFEQSLVNAFRPGVVVSG